MVSSCRKGRLVAVFLCSLALFPLQTLSSQAEETGTDVTSKQTAVEQDAVGGVNGIASYYANHYKGKRTTSGARYNPQKMTAAHPDLPLGSKVRVINLDNGREVLVTIIDRCREKAVPFIDLSRAAARKLGFLGKGKTRVAIIPLAEEPS